METSSFWRTWKTLFAVATGSKRASRKILGGVEDLTHPVDFSAQGAAALSAVYIARLAVEYDVRIVPHLDITFPVRIQLDPVQVWAVVLLGLLLALLMGSVAIYTVMNYVSRAAHPFTISLRTFAYLEGFYLFVLAVYIYMDWLPFPKTSTANNELGTPNVLLLFLWSIWAFIIFVRLHMNVFGISLAKSLGAFVLEGIAWALQMVAVVLMLALAIWLMPAD